MRATWLRSPGKGSSHLNIHRSDVVDDGGGGCELAGWRRESFRVRVYICKGFKACVCVMRECTTVRHRPFWSLNEAHSSGYYRGDRVIVSLRERRFSLNNHTLYSESRNNGFPARTLPLNVSCFPRSISRRLSQNQSAYSIPLRFRRWLRSSRAIFQEVSENMVFPPSWIIIYIVQQYIMQDVFNVSYFESSWKINS